MSTSHDATVAVLNGGGNDGREVPISAGQTRVEFSERFENDQGHTIATDVYLFQAIDPADPNRARFTFSVPDSGTDSVIDS